MGGEANKHNGIIIEQVDSGAGTTTGAGGNKGSSTKSKSTADTGTTTGAGGSGNSGSTGAGTTPGKEKIVPGLVNLTEQEKRDKRNARRRERYAKQKAEQGQTVKPRKVNTKKADATPSLSNEQLNSFIISISAVIASRPKCEHWLLTEAEVNSITKPLSAMLKESEVFEKIGEHSNQIALIIACVSVFMPRIIKTVAQIQEDKKNEQRVKQSIEERNKIKNHKPGGENGGGATSSGAASSKNNSINEYWFGEAIY